MAVKSTVTPTNQVKNILLLGSKFGARLFRRNVGMGWIGNSTVFKKQQTLLITINPGDVLIRQARPFHNGEVGQYDTYGMKPVLITQDMVGKKIAQHVEIEAKQGSGRESKEQKAWGAFVRSFGGLAGVARSDEDALAILRGEIRD